MVKELEITLCVDIDEHLADIPIYIMYKEKVTTVILRRVMEFQRFIIPECAWKTVRIDEFSKGLAPVKIHPVMKISVRDIENNRIISRLSKFKIFGKTFYFGNA